LEGESLPCKQRSGNFSAVPSRLPGRICGAGNRPWLASGPVPMPVPAPAGSCCPWDGATWVLMLAPLTSGSLEIEFGCAGPCSQYSTSTTATTSFNEYQRTKQEPTQPPSRCRMEGLKKEFILLSPSLSSVPNPPLSSLRHRSSPKFLHPPGTRQYLSRPWPIKVQFGLRQTVPAPSSLL